MRPILRSLAPVLYARAVQRLKSLAGYAFLVVMFLVCFWPGAILDLVPAARAAAGYGTPGTMRLDERLSAKTALWAGEYRSDDGRIVLERVTLAPGRGTYRVGDRVPVLYNRTPDLWINSGQTVYLRSGNGSWIFPAFVSAAWIVLFTWAGYRLRRGLLRRGPLRERVLTAPAPSCTCANVDHCEHA